MDDFDYFRLADDITSSEFIDGCMISKLQYECGEGTMSIRKVIDGVYIVFSDFNLSECNSRFQVDADILCVDHCREGRIEQELPNGVYSYLSAGDLRVDNRTSHNTNFSMPLSHYYGITVAVFLDSAESAVAAAMPGFPVSLRGLYDKFCSGNTFFIIRSEPQIEHIFSELYSVPSEIKDYYYRIKIFELLLYLDALNIGNYDQSRPYFYKAQVEKIKAIANLITEELDTHYTLENLSKRFDIPLTAMKLCFKGVYGTSIYSYLRSVRINKAGRLLKETDSSITMIASEVGYNSPSKFSAAFKDVMKMNPLEYRKNL